MEVLKETDYSVTHVDGEDVTVDLMKHIGGVDILVLRVHSALKNGDIWVFTGERYVKDRYLVEQLTSEVHRARTSLQGEYLFAVSQHYFQRVLPEMEGTKVLVMGCDGAITRELADIFLDKGASLYVSWDGTVSLEHTDLVFSRILEEYSGGKSMIEAVEAVEGELGADPHFGSALRCFN